MFPIVCTTAVDPKLIDDFLRTSYDGYPEASQELCIITSRDRAAYQHDESKPSKEEIARGMRVKTQGGGPMKTPSRPPWKVDFSPPFLNKSPEEVAKVLRYELDNTLLGLDYCAIIDVKSLQDRRALVMHTVKPEDEHEYKMVRVPFEEVNAVLVCCSIGETDLDDVSDAHPP